MREEFTTDPDQIYQQYETQAVQDFIPQELPITAVTNINGASGPNISFTSPDGFSFSPAGNNVVFSVSNASLARAALGAAKSGVNADITSFTGLTGNTGFAAWTGTADGATHATYPTTVASAGYVQAEIQGLMDKMKQATELLKKLVDAGLAAGTIEA